MLPDAINLVYLHAISIKVTKIGMNAMMQHTTITGIFPALLFQVPPELTSIHPPYMVLHTFTCIDFNISSVKV